MESPFGNSPYYIVVVLHSAFHCHKITDAIISDVGVFSSTSIFYPICSWYFSYSGILYLKAGRQYVSHRHVFYSFVVGCLYRQVDHNKVILIKSIASYQLALSIIKLFPHFQERVFLSVASINTDAFSFPEIIQRAIS